MEISEKDNYLNIVEYANQLKSKGLFDELYQYMKNNGISNFSKLFNFPVAYQKGENFAYDWLIEKEGEGRYTATEVDGKNKDSGGCCVTCCEGLCVSEGISATVGVFQACCENCCHDPCFTNPNFFDHTEKLKHFLCPLTWGYECSYHIVHFCCFECG